MRRHVCACAVRYYSLCGCMIVAKDITHPTILHTLHTLLTCEFNTFTHKKQHEETGTVYTNLYLFLCRTVPVFSCWFLCVLNTHTHTHAHTHMYAHRHVDNIKYIEGMNRKAHNLNEFSNHVKCSRNFEYECC